MTEPARLDLASNPLERDLANYGTDRTPVIRALDPGKRIMLITSGNAEPTY
jgi:hypothetical protein